MASSLAGWQAVGVAAEPNRCTKCRNKVPYTIHLTVHGLCEPCDRWCRGMAKVGIKRLEEMLANHLAFSAWCERHGR